jgi:hypothetical protein
MFSVFFCLHIKIAAKQAASTKPISIRVERVIAVAGTEPRTDTERVSVWSPRLFASCPSLSVRTWMAK